MATGLKDALSRVINLIKERSYLVTLLTLLNADIVTRRELEGVRGIHHQERQSIRVEKIRLGLQDDLKNIDIEIEAVLNLVVNLARESNENRG